jgi:glycosyltransferase involved in cell wall biosynthesis
MIICINGRFLTQPLTGVQRYATEVLKALDNLIDARKINPDKYSFILLIPKNAKNIPNLKYIETKKIGILKGHLWEQFELPIYSRNKLLICLCNTGSLFKKKQVLTIHDAAVFATPSSYSFVFRRLYKLLLPLISKRAKKVITVSNFSKKELKYYCNIDDSKIEVIYEGVDHIHSLRSDEAILQKYNLGNIPFLLAVGSMLNPNKNINSIIKAVSCIKANQFELVIAGRSDPKIFTQNKLSDTMQVKVIEGINDSELKALYGKAILFIFPSLYEGFGIPPLEAMACNCPVIASNAASLPEICGEAAYYVDPHDTEDIAKGIKAFSTDKTLRNKFIKKGKEQIKQYTWEKTALELIKNISQFTSIELE